MNEHKKEPMLVVRRLVKHFPITSGLTRRLRDTVRAVDNISFDIVQGETLGLVGESGSGKTTLGRCLLRLIEPSSGSIRMDGVEITELSKRELRALRKKMQYIFQDATSSLDPTMSIGEIILEGPNIHGIGTMHQRRQLLHELLVKIGLNPNQADQYPGSFSGGQRQRIGIARALALNPQFIIADEPVTALDPSIQAQVLNLLHELQADYGLTYLFIAHDLTVVEHVSDRVAVMYCGKLVEIAPTDQLFGRPLHPYTQLLLSAADRVTHRVGEHGIAGEYETGIPQGCRFHPRCLECMQDVCPSQDPPLIEIEPEHWVACWLYPAEDVG
jgi:peptide/nickel transport system ATP-binding protein/oligopeptide transport system ATP-binding protein